MRLVHMEFVFLSLLLFYYYFTNNIVNVVFAPIISSTDFLPCTKENLCHNFTFNVVSDEQKYTEQRSLQWNTMGEIPSSKTHFLPFYHFNTPYYLPAFKNVSSWAAEVSSFWPKGQSRLFISKMKWNQQLEYSQN